MSNRLENSKIYYQETNTFGATCKISDENIKFQPYPITVQTVVGNTRDFWREILTEYKFPNILIFNSTQCHRI